MPLKPNGATCKVREQIIEDAASGLTLQFECDDGRLRVVLAGKPLALGNREILFDDQGREAGGQREVDACNSDRYSAQGQATPDTVGQERDREPTSD